MKKNKYGQNTSGFVVGVTNKGPVEQDDENQKWNMKQLDTYMQYESQFTQPIPINTNGLVNNFMGETGAVTIMTLAQQLQTLLFQCEQFRNNLIPEATLYQFLNDGFQTIQQTINYLKLQPGIDLKTISTALMNFENESKVGMTENIIQVIDTGINRLVPSFKLFQDKTNDNIHSTTFISELDKINVILSTRLQKGKSYDLSSRTQLNSIFQSLIGFSRNMTNSTQNEKRDMALKMIDVEKLINSSTLPDDYIKSLHFDDVLNKILSNLSVPVPNMGTSIEATQNVPNQTVVQISNQNFTIEQQLHKLLSGVNPTIDNYNDAIKLARTITNQKIKDMINNRIDIMISSSPYKNLMRTNDNLLLDTNPQISISQVSAIPHNATPHGQPQIPEISSKIYQQLSTISGIDRLKNKEIEIIKQSPNMLNKMVEAYTVLYNARKNNAISIYKQLMAKLSNLGINEHLVQNLDQMNKLKIGVDLEQSVKQQNFIRAKEAEKQRYEKLERDKAIKAQLLLDEENKALGNTPFVPNNNDAVRLGNLNDENDRILNEVTVYSKNFINIFEPINMAVNNVNDILYAYKLAQSRMNEGVQKASIDNSIKAIDNFTQYIPKMIHYSSLNMLNKKDMNDIVDVGYYIKKIKNLPKSITDQGSAFCEALIQRNLNNQIQIENNVRTRLAEDAKKQELNLENVQENVQEPAPAVKNLPIQAIKVEDEEGDDFSLPLPENLSSMFVKSVRMDPSKVAASLKLCQSYMIAYNMLLIQKSPNGFEYFSHIRNNDLVLSLYLSAHLGMKTLSLCKITSQIINEDELRIAIDEYTKSVYCRGLLYNLIYSIYKGQPADLKLYLPNIDKNIKLTPPNEKFAVDTTVALDKFASANITNREIYTELDAKVIKLTNNLENMD